MCKVTSLSAIKRNCEIGYFPELIKVSVHTCTFAFSIDEPTMTFAFVTTVCIFTILITTMLSYI